MEYDREGWNNDQHHPKGSDPSQEHPRSHGLSDYTLPPSRLTDMRTMLKFGKVYSPLIMYAKKRYAGLMWTRHDLNVDSRKIGGRCGGKPHTLPFSGACSAPCALHPSLVNRSN
uniref:DNA-directed DNA polymerase n=1 Tax=Haptolina ericina TaxID=156174 RepID=A0A7S3F419_9EUKA|mmetsp:Transcript_52139/g.117073  ORF Transcript_52139/g.117073 Transcript_52139/m.117073 type:complete len:114 (+) Transcript_52139:504-845(+)